MRVFLICLILSFSSVFVYSADFGLTLYPEYSISSISNENQVPAGIKRPINSFTADSKTGNFGLGLSLDYYLLDQKIKLSLKGTQRITDFEFNDDEKVLIGIEGVPILATLRHNFILEVKSLAFEPFAEFVVYENLALQAGVKFVFNRSANYSTSQKIVFPENYEFIYPLPEQKNKKINPRSLNINPNIGLAYYPAFFRNPYLNIGVYVNYEYALNSVLPNGFGNYSNINIGFSASKIFSSRKPTFFSTNIDSVFVRDTIETFSSNVINAMTILSNKYYEEKTEVIDNIEYKKIIVNEEYSKLIPKMKALLSGEVKTKFIMPAGNETDKFNSSVVKYIYESIYCGNDFKQKNIKNIRIKDTIVKTTIPDLKFYLDVESEAGLKKWEFIIKNGKNIIKKYDGFNIPNDPIFWNMKDDISEKKLDYDFSFELILTDKEDQTLKAAQGTISINEKSSVNSINNVKKYIIPIETKNRNENLVSELKKQIGKKSVEIFSSRELSEEEKQSLRNEIGEIRTYTLEIKKAGGELPAAFNCMECVIAIVE